MATQADLDDKVRRLNAALDGIREEITAAKQANPGLDLSGLETAVGKAEGEANGVADLPVSDGTEPAQGSNTGADSGKHETTDTGTPTSTVSDWSV